MISRRREKQEWKAEVMINRSDGQKERDRRFERHKEREQETGFRVRMRNRQSERGIGRQKI